MSTLIRILRSSALATAAWCASTGCSSTPDDAPSGGGASAVTPPTVDTSTTALEQTYQTVMGGYVRARRAALESGAHFASERELAERAMSANAADIAFPSLCDSLEVYRNVRDGAPELRPLLFTGMSGTLTIQGTDITVGGEAVFSIKDGQLGAFAYLGDGAGTTHTGASASAYSGVAFNVRNGAAYPTLLDLWSGTFGSTSASVPVMPNMPITAGGQFFSGWSNGTNNLDIVGGSASAGFSAGVSWLGVPDWLPSGGYATACFVPANPMTQSLADTLRPIADNTVVQKNLAVCGTASTAYKYVQFSRDRHPLIPQLVINAIGQELPNTSMAVRLATAHGTLHAPLAGVAPWVLGSTEASILAMGIGRDFDTRADAYYKASCPKTTNKFCASQVVGIAPDAKMILGALGFRPETVRDEARAYCVNQRRTFFADTRALNPLAAYPSCEFNTENPASWIEYAGIKGFVDARSGSNVLPNHAAKKKVLAKLVVAAYLVKNGIAADTNGAYQHVAQRLLQTCGGTGCFFSDTNNDVAYAVWVDGMGLLALADGTLGADGRRAFGVDAVLQKAGVAKLAIRASGVGPGSQDPAWASTYFPDAADLRPSEWRYYVNFMGNKGYAQGTANCSADSPVP